jgi:hypothetical protein
MTRYGVSLSLSLLCEGPRIRFETFCGREEGPHRFLEDALMNGQSSAKSFGRRFSYLGYVKHRITLAFEEAIAYKRRMRTLNVIALAVGLAALSAAQDDPRKIDVYNLFPNVGTMIVEAEPNDAGVPPGIIGDCPGTLIRERVILTAGHCTRRSEFGTPPFIHVYFSLACTFSMTELPGFRYRRRRGIRRYCPALLRLQVARGIRRYRACRTWVCCCSQRICLGL